MAHSSGLASPYQVGGSLPIHATSYVTRQADQQLYQALLRGDFCYVFNARQMGKSSLRVQTMQRLGQVGVTCAAIDLTTIGTQQVTPEQWYASLAALLTSQFKLPIKLGEWWRQHGEISFIGRLQLLFETVLFPQISGPIVIFIDEADSILGLPFETHDFFAFIRSCYNQRADQPDYQRLSFVLLGVATPSTLMRNKSMTPFNIGVAIELSGFQWVEALPLMQGLRTVMPNPRTVLGQILAWSGGQPFLTQKLCHLARQHLPPQAIALDADQLATVMGEIVTKHVIKNWESQDEPEHLRTIRDRILHDPQQAPQLLTLYQKLLLSPEGRLPVEHCPAQRELILSGLLHQQQGFLQVKNPIYEAVFNADWIDQQLARFIAVAPPTVPHPRPSADPEDPGKVSPTGAPTGDIPTGETPATATSTDTPSTDTPSTDPVAVSPRTDAAKPNGFRQSRRIGPRLLIAGWCSTSALLIGSNIWQYHQIQQLERQQITTDRTAAIAIAAQKNWQPALLHALRANQMAQSRLGAGQSGIAQAAYQDFQRIVYQAVQADPQVKLDRLRHPLRAAAPQSADSSTIGAIFHPQKSQILLSDRPVQPNSAADRPDHQISYQQISLWDFNGHPQGHWQVPHQRIALHPQAPVLFGINQQHQLVRWTLPPQQPKVVSQLPAIPVRHLLWSRDGKTLLVGLANGEIQLRTETGELANQLKPDPGEPIGEITSLIPAAADQATDPQFISGGADGVIRFWQMDGKQHHGFPVGAGVIELALSQNGQVLVGLLNSGQVVIANEQGVVQRWTIPLPAMDLPAHIATQANGTLIAIATTRGNIHFYQQNGTTIGDLPGNNHPLTDLNFSADGSQLLTTSNHGQVDLWNLTIAQNPENWLAYGCAQLRPYLENPLVNLSDRDRRRCDQVPGLDAIR